MEKHDDIVGESAVSELENEKPDGSASANFFGIAEDACLLPQVLDTSARSEDDTKQNNVLAVATNFFQKILECSVLGLATSHVAKLHMAERMPVTEVRLARLGV